MKDLRSFLSQIKQLEPAYYREIEQTLEPDFDLSVIQLKLARFGVFPIIYGAHVRGSAYPVVTGLFADYIHLGIALGLNPEEIIRNGRESIIAACLKRKLKTIPCQEVSIDQAPVQERVTTGDKVNLFELPVQKHAAHNRGKFVTAGVTLVRDPDSGILNAGVYRQLLLSPNRITCKMVAKHDGAHCVNKWHAAGKAAPVVTFIGHHPAVFMAACHGLEKGRSELDYAGALLGEPLEVVPAVSVDLVIPARAEIAIEGEIRPGDLADDTPFSEASGYYEGDPKVYVITVNTISTRRDAIYHNLCPIHPEHTNANIINWDTEILRSIQKVMPNVKAAHLGPDGDAAKNIFYISLEKQAVDDARLVVETLTKAGIFPKFVVVVDHDIDIYYQPDVLWALVMRYQASTQVIHYPGGSGGIDVIDLTGTLDKPWQERAMPPEEAWSRIHLEDFLSYNKEISQIDL